jgi:hypothetical protein
VPRALGSCERLIVCLAHRLNLLPLQLGCSCRRDMLIVWPKGSNGRGREGGQDKPCNSNKAATAPQPYALGDNGNLLKVFKQFCAMHVCSAVGYVCRLQHATDRGGLRHMHSVCKLRGFHCAFPLTPCCSSITHNTWPGYKSKGRYSKVS